MKISELSKTIAKELSLLQDDSFDGAVRYAKRMHQLDLDYYYARLHQMGFSGGTVLDAGSGTGTWSFALSKLYEHVYAVDRHQGRLDLCDRLIECCGLHNIYTLNKSLDILDFESDSFDAVFCYGVIISALDLKNTLKEFSRILKPGGLLYVCLNGIGWSSFLKNVRGEQDGRYALIGSDGIYNSLCNSYFNSELASFGNTAGGLLGFLNKVSFQCGGNDYYYEYVYSKLSEYIYLDKWPYARLLRARKLGDIDSELTVPVSKARDFILGISSGLEILYGHSFLASLFQSIESRLDEFYVKLFAEDIFNIVSHNAASFSLSRAGRGYSVEEACYVLNGLCFTNIEFDYEGGLSNSASVDSKLVPIYEGMYENELCVWELKAKKI